MGLLKSGPFRIRINRASPRGRELTLFKINEDGTSGGPIHLSPDELPTLKELIDGQSEVSRIVASLDGKI